MFRINSEILSIIDAVSNEKSISKNIVISAIEEAFTKIAENYYGSGGDVFVKMDVNNGNLSFFQKKIVKNKPIFLNEISLSDAKKINPEAEIDGYVNITLPQIPMPRNTVFTMRKTILEKIKGAEKELEYNEYKKREGEIINGVVKKSTSFSCIVNLGASTEAIIFRDGLLKTDNYKSGDKIKAYIKEVKRSDYDCQIILSRTDNNFLAMLIAENCVEVQDGMIEIKAISRSCGVKSKVAVFSSDSRLDAVGACIGARGSRIKPVMEELRGERVDIVNFDNDLVMFAKNAITPAKALYGEYIEATNSVELIIADDQLKLAIGKNGLNVRLASQLIGCNITIIAESEKKKSNQEKFAKSVELLCTALDIEEPVGQFLVSSNIYTPEDLVNVGADKLTKSGVFTEEISNELINRAQLYINEEDKKLDEQLKKLDIDKQLLEIEGMTKKVALLLGTNNIKTINDLADLSSDEFIEICGEEHINIANQLIMTARKIAYNI